MWSSAGKANDAQQKTEKAPLSAGASTVTKDERDATAAQKIPAF